MNDILGIETLESRLLFNAIELDGTSLEILGGPGADMISVTVTRVQRAYLVKGSINDVGFVFKTELSQIAVGGYGGNDRITIKADGIQEVTKVRVDAGDGDDTVQIEANQGAKVGGGAGNDSITVTGGGHHNVEGSAGNDMIVVDNDMFTDVVIGASYADGGDGDDVLISRGLAPHTLMGGAGSNKLYGSDGTTYFYVGRTGNSLNRIFGGKGDDVVRITGSGRVIVSGGGGSNRVLVTRDLFSRRQTSKLTKTDDVRLIIT